MPIAPHPAAAVVANSTRLAEALARGGRAGRPRPRRLLGRRRRPAASRRSTSRWRAARGRPTGWTSSPKSRRGRAALEIVKRQWGAFHGTELDLQLQAARPRHDRADRRRHQFRRRADGARGLAARLFGRRRRGRDKLIDSARRRTASPSRRSCRGFRGCGRPRRLSPRWGDFAPAPSTALTRGPPPPLCGGGWERAPFLPRAKRGGGGPRVARWWGC